MLPLLHFALLATRWSRAGGTANLRSSNAPSREEVGLPLHRPSSAWMAASSSSSATACSGLMAAALPIETQSNFQQLCHVVGDKFGVVSADVLFNLRRDMRKNDASAACAFQQIFAAADAPEVAELITRATSAHKTLALLLECRNILLQLGALEQLRDRRGLVHRVGSRLSHVARSVTTIDARRACESCISACIGNCCILL